MCGLLHAHRKKAVLIVTQADSHPEHMKILIFSAVTMLCCGHALAQVQRNIAFDVSSPDTAAHSAAIRHVAHLARAYPNTQLEIVVYGRAINMISLQSSTVATTLRKPLLIPNVKVMACRISLDKHHMRDDHVISGVDIVPDAIIELADKQNNGWAYIKEQ